VSAASTPGWFAQDQASRHLRAWRVVELLQNNGYTASNHTKLLDLGCSLGFMSDAFAELGFAVTGIDPDPRVFSSREQSSAAAASAKFICAQGESLPFVDGVFDVVVCNHVYEHAINPMKMMAEIHRTLRPGGVCYFAGGHKWQLIEPHYRLPFLSWLPSPIANIYLRCFKGIASYDEKFVYPWQLKFFFEGFSSTRELTPQLLRKPAHYRVGPTALGRFIQNSPLIASLTSRLSVIVPTRVWLLVR
jgi:SAM-dependent methyltransferase